MDAALSAFLGLLFLFLGFAAVLLMFRIWGYPFDHERHISSAPAWLVLVHRAVGLAYLVLYLVMMYHMVPRLFLYQVEFAPRTVAHLMLGVSIGFLLFTLMVKVATPIMLGAFRVDARVPADAAVRPAATH